MSEIPKPESNYVKFFDTTLRDGVQSPGIALTTEQSLQIAQQVDRMGIDIIEAGFPISSPGNFEAVKTIAQEVRRPIVAALARAEPEDIRVAAEALRDAEQPRIHTFISTSDIHIEHQMQTTREDVKKLAKAAVAQAKEFVDDVQFSPMDATRAEVEYTAEIVQIAIDEGATTINIPDTVGYTEPDEFQDYLRRLRQYVPVLGTAGVVLSVHCHEDLGMATANSLAGVKAGARQVEGAVNGLGERAGNAALEEIAMALEVRNDIYQVKTGINTKAIAPTSRMVARHTGYPVQKNKAIVGANAFQHESGIHQGGVLRNRSTFEIMRAADVGMDTDGIALGRQSGRSALKHVLEQEGTFDGSVMVRTFEMFKDLTDKVGGVSREQLVEIHEEAKRRQSSPYSLGKYEVSASGNGKEGVYSATVVVDDGSGHNRDPVSATNDDLEHPSVDGATSALFTAIKDAVMGMQGIHQGHPWIEFNGFELNSIGEGQQTIGRATVSMKVNGKPVTGHGLAFDTMKASGWAYLDALRQA